MSSGQKITAVTVDDLGGHMLTDDGKYALFKFGSGGKEFVLSFAVTDMPSLLVSVVAAFAKTQQRPKMAKGTALAFKVDWFEAHSQPSGTAVLSLRLEDSGFLNFELPAGMTTQMKEVFASMDGEPTIPPTPGTRPS